MEQTNTKNNCIKKLNPEKELIYGNGSYFTYAIIEKVNFAKLIYEKTSVSFYEYLGPENLFFSLPLDIDSKENDIDPIIFNNIAEYLIKLIPEMNIYYIILTSHNISIRKYSYHMRIRLYYKRTNKEYNFKSIRNLKDIASKLKKKICNEIDLSIYPEKGKLIRSIFASKPKENRPLLVNILLSKLPNTDYFEIIKFSCFSLEYPIDTMNLKEENKIDNNNEINNNKKLRSENLVFKKIEYEDDLFYNLINNNENNDTIEEIISSSSSYMEPNIKKSNYSNNKITVKTIEPIKAKLSIEIIEMFLNNIVYKKLKLIHTEPYVKVEYKGYCFLSERIHKNNRQTIVLKGNIIFTGCYDDMCRRKILKKFPLPFNSNNTNFFNKKSNEIKSLFIDYLNLGEWKKTIETEFFKNKNFIDYDHEICNKTYSHNFNYKEIINREIINKEIINREIINEIETNTIELVILHKLNLDKHKIIIKYDGIIKEEIEAISFEKSKIFQMITLIRNSYINYNIENLNLTFVVPQHDKNDKISIKSIKRADCIGSVKKGPTREEWWKAVEETELISTIKLDLKNYFSTKLPVTLIRLFIDNKGLYYLNQKIYKKNKKTLELIPLNYQSECSFFQDFIVEESIIFMNYFTKENHGIVYDFFNNMVLTERNIRGIVKNFKEMYLIKEENINPKDLINTTNGVFNTINCNYKSQEEYNKLEKNIYFSYMYSLEDVKEEFIYNLFKKTFNNNYNTFLNFFHYLVAGIINKSDISYLIILSGDGSNGKSLLIKKILSAFPNHSGSLEGIDIEAKNGLYVNPLLRNLSNKYFWGINELPGNIKTKFLKTLCGKDEMISRELYSNILRKQVFNGACIAATNEELVFENCDFSVARRVKVFKLKEKVYDINEEDKEKKKIIENENFLPMFRNFIIQKMEEEKTYKLEDTNDIEPLIYKEKLNINYEEFINKYLKYEKGTFTKVSDIGKIRNEYLENKCIQYNYQLFDAALHRKIQIVFKDKGEIRKIKKRFGTNTVWTYMDIMMVNYNEEEMF